MTGSPGAGIEPPSLPHLHRLRDGNRYAAGMSSSPRMVTSRSGWAAYLNSSHVQGRISFSPMDTTRPTSVATRQEIQRHLATARLSILPVVTTPSVESAPTHDPMEFTPPPRLIRAPPRGPRTGVGGSEQQPGWTRVLGVGSPPSPPAPRCCRERVSSLGTSNLVSSV